MKTEMSLNYFNIGQNFVAEIILLQFSTFQYFILHFVNCSVQYFTVKKKALVFTQQTALLNYGIKVEEGFSAQFPSSYFYQKPFL